ncbi:GTP-binding protein sey1 [Alternaria alternata]|uniref:Uncharacterized protein n=1 Tax=Alternaria tenuissima TaxID=119927 RepID=A0AB37WNW9_9PLEO|nr:GTP-binding protein sey1 [Alternaria alternata]RYN31885.1 hypothetical protein AA0115_g4175 [Alternaria tenuissima]
MSQSDIPRTLESISQTLIPNTNLVHPPKKPQDAQLTATIADLHVHPTIETLLHILNHDLPSAHFLVRHMQAPPAVEGMLLHGILHRAEGDFDNARAWVGDVADACEGYQPKHKEEGQKLDAEVAKQVGSNSSISASLIEFVYGDQEPKSLIDAVEEYRSKKKIDRANDEDGIENRIRAEAEKVLEWCKNKFGDGVFDDATKAWVKNSEEISKISGDMEPHVKRSSDSTGETGAKKGWFGPALDGNVHAHYRTQPGF